MLNPKWLTKISTCLTLIKHQDDSKFKWNLIFAFRKKGVLPNIAPLSNSEAWGFSLTPICQ